MMSTLGIAGHAKSCRLIQSVSTGTLKSPQIMKEEVRDDRELKKTGNLQQRSNIMNLVYNRYRQ